MMHRLAWLMAMIFLCAEAAPAAPRERRDFDATLKLRPDEIRGQQIFSKCAGCHGADGGGQVTGSVPRIAGQHFRVLVRQIVDFRHGKRWDPRMEGVATSHESMPELQDVADVARYLSHQSPHGPRGVGEGLYLDTGAMIYAARCASCHGAAGEGNDTQGVPRIAGQHAAYLSRQIYDAVDGRRPELSRTHGRRLAPLDFQEVQGLADWLSRVGSSPAPPPVGGSAEPAVVNAR
jgi:cytochrome c553